MTFRNFFMLLKSKIKRAANDVWTFIINNESGKREYITRNKLDDCIDRAAIAYYTITGFQAPKLITAKQLENILQFTSYEKLRDDIAAQCTANDYEYILLLSLAVVNVFKPNEIAPLLPISNNTKQLK